MKITKIKLKLLIEANLAVYGEDRVMGRFLNEDASYFGNSFVNYKTLIHQAAFLTQITALDAFKVHP